MGEPSEARRKWALVALMASVIAAFALVLAGLGLPGGLVLGAGPIAVLRFLRPTPTSSPSTVLGDDHLRTREPRADADPGSMRNGGLSSGDALRASLVALAVVILLVVTRAEAAAWVPALVAPAAAVLLLLRDRRFPRVLAADARRDRRAMIFFGISIGTLTALALLGEAIADHLR